MSSKSLFASASTPSSRTSHQTSSQPTSTNGAGASGYAQTERLALATLALTSTFAPGFYRDAPQQLSELLTAARSVSDEYLAQTIIYASQQGKMKDTVAALSVLLSTRNPALFRKVFPVVADAKFVRNFVQIVRSGQVGRKSLGRGPKDCIKSWLRSLDGLGLIRASIGNEPTLKDIVSLTHFRPSPDMAESFKWATNRPFSVDGLRSPIAQLETFKARRAAGEQPNIPESVPHLLLTSLDLTTKNWQEVAASMTWNQIRMNLNTLERHGCFKDAAFVQYIAKRLDDADAVRKARVFPHAIKAAYDAAESVPTPIRLALQNCIDHATLNIPALDGKHVIVAVDFSPSMQAAVTGSRGSATSVVTCCDVASLFAAVLVKKNPLSTLIRFDDRATVTRLNPNDSIATLTNQIKGNGCGTDCSTPVSLALRDGIGADVVIIMSDQESWVNNKFGAHTPLSRAWNAYKQTFPNAKLVLCDLEGNTTSQAPGTKDVLCLAGFTDSFFTLVEDFAKTGQSSKTVNLVKEIESVEIGNLRPVYLGA